jgi:hypothetical protein
MPGTGLGPSDVADWDWDSILDSQPRVVALVLLLFFFGILIVTSIMPGTVDPLVIVLIGIAGLVIVLLTLRARWASAKWGVKDPVSEEEDIPDPERQPTPGLRGRRLPHGEDYYSEKERISEEERNFEGESGPEED